MRIFLFLTVLLASFCTDNSGSVKSLGGDPELGQNSNLNNENENSDSDNNSNSNGGFHSLCEVFLGDNEINYFEYDGICYIDKATDLNRLIFDRYSKLVSVGDSEINEEEQEVATIYNSDLTAELIEIKLSEIDFTNSTDSQEPGIDHISPRYTMMDNDGGEPERETVCVDWPIFDSTREKTCHHVCMTITAGAVISAGAIIGNVAGAMIVGSIAYYSKRGYKYACQRYCVWGGYTKKIVGYKTRCTSH